jgi:tripartite-type tricarboxylate transporter receptor subunit TctC
MSLVRHAVSVIVLSVGIVLPQAIHAQAFPSKPLKLVVPFVPGGTSELLARVLAKKMGEGLGQPVLIENIGGAGSTLGTGQVARAAPDGYTMVFAYNSGLTIAPGLYPKLAYDPLTSFTPIGTVARFYMIVTAHTSIPANSMQELIAYAKANPGKLSYGTAGVGSTLHLMGEILRASTGVNITHVPYKGMRPAILDYMAGRIDLAWDAGDSLMPLIKDGKIKPLAVTSRNRLAILPDVPTVYEAGVPELGIFVWTALLGPAGIPPEVAARLEAELGKALAAPDVQKTFVDRGYEMFPGSPRELQDLMRQEVPRWTSIIRSAGVKLE